MNSGERASSSTPQRDDCKLEVRLAAAVCQAIDYADMEEKVVREVVDAVSQLLAPRLVTLQTAHPSGPQLVAAEVTGDWAGPEPRVLALCASEGSALELDFASYAVVEEPSPLARGAVVSARAPLYGPALSGLITIERTTEPSAGDDQDRTLARSLAGVLSGALCAYRHHRRLVARQTLADAAIRQSEALLCVLDTDSRVTFFNPALERLTGYGESEVLTVPIGQWLCRGGDESLAKVILETLAGRPSRGFETRLPLKTGGCATALVTAAPVYGEDHTIEGVALVGLGQHQLADLARRSEARMARLRRIAAGVAARLERPATSLQSQVARLGGGDAADSADALVEIGRVADSLRLLAGRLDVLSGAQEEESVRFSVNQVVEAALGDAAEPLAARQIRVRTALAGELPDLTGMPGRLRRAVRSLLINASQAQSARITLRTWDNRDGTVGISVADNGHGITEEHLEHVFKPFYTVRRESDSMGLGLAVVQDTVEAHDGTVDIDSAEGDGTVVTITLPVRRPSEEEPVEA
ncbi:MAG: ATP-binding protein [bacterium]